MLDTSAPVLVKISFCYVMFTIQQVYIRCRFGDFFVSNQSSQVLQIIMVETLLIHKYSNTQIETYLVKMPHGWGELDKYSNTQIEKYPKNS